MKKNRIKVRIILFTIEKFIRTCIVLASVFLSFWVFSYSFNKWKESVASSSFYDRKPSPRIFSEHIIGEWSTLRNVLLLVLLPIAVYALVILIIKIKRKNYLSAIKGCALWIFSLFLIQLSFILGEVILDLVFLGGYN